MTIKVVVANLNAKTPNSRRYRRHLRRTHRPDAMLLQEVGGLGPRSTRVAGRKVFRRRRTEVGNVGAHRWVATGQLRAGRTIVGLGSAHALHPGTVGRAAQNAWYAHLTKGAKVGPHDIVGADWNRHYALAGELLGGKSVGRGVDGIVYGSRLRLITHSIDTTGLRAGWTDHPAIVATFEVL